MKAAATSQLMVAWECQDMQAAKQGSRWYRNVFQTKEQEYLIINHDKEKRKLLVEEEGLRSTMDYFIITIKNNIPD